MRRLNTHYVCARPQQDKMEIVCVEEGLQLDDIDVDDNDKISNSDGENILD